MMFFYADDWPELEDVDRLLSWNVAVDVLDVAADGSSQPMEVGRRKICQFLVIRHRGYVDRDPEELYTPNINSI